MLFARIVYCAILIGVCAGLLVSGMQVIAVDPIIFEAESFEGTEPAADAEPSEAHDGHSHDGWAPRDGWQRTLSSILSNAFAAMGFAAIMLALMNQLWSTRGTPLRPWQGLLWGVAGFATFYLAPALGLHPEIPGIEAAPIQARQLWWLLTVVCVGTGLACLVFLGGGKRWIGAILLAIPYIIGAPGIEGPPFTHSDPAVVSSLTDLHQRFIWLSSGVNLAHWLVLGVLCAWAFNRWLLTDD